MPDATRSVLVTGGSRGLGLAICRKLAGSGYQVIAVARRKNKDLTAALAQAGRESNAALGFEGALAMMHNAKIEEQVRVNTLSPIVLTKYVVRGMMSAGAGRIVNVASIIGATGYSGLAAYAATKTSMLGFTRSLAREVGRLGITVNAVSPGFLATDMTSIFSDEQRQQIVRRTALRRFPEVDDVADAVEFLLSDKARNITGTVLTVDAGTTA